MSKKNLLYLLLSIVLAFGMWLYVITVVNPESEETFYDVPVVLKNMESLQDKELMLILEENPTVTLDLIGNRTDLVRLNKSDITVMVDLARIYEPGEHELNYSVSFPANEGGAHKLTNTGTETLAYIDFDVIHDLDAAVYPDSGKIGIWGKGINKIYPKDGNVDYYDGE